jgi:hypothetical protein
MKNWFHSRAFKPLRSNATCTATTRRKSFLIVSQHEQKLKRGLLGIQGQMKRINNMEAKKPVPPKNAAAQQRWGWDIQIWQTFRLPGTTFRLISFISEFAILSKPLPLKHDASRYDSRYRPCNHQI